jgi:hypothetical protein
VHGGAQRRLGRGDQRRRGGEQRRHRDHGVDRDGQAEREGDRLRDRPRGLGDLLAERRDPRVAGECEEEDPAGAEGAEHAAVRVREVRPVDGPAEERCRDEHSESTEDERDDGARQARGLVDPGQVHGREGDGGADRERARDRRRGVVPERERHRSAAGELPDDERRPGQVAPDVTETPPPVDVRPARLGVERGQPGRGGRVAVGDRAGDDEPDQQRDPAKAADEPRRIDQRADRDEEQDRQQVPEREQPPTSLRRVRTVADCEAGDERGEGQRQLRDDGADRGDGQAGRHRHDQEQVVLAAQAAQDERQGARSHDDDQRVGTKRRQRHR